MADNAEKLLYKGGPSQAINWNTYLWCGVLLVLAIMAEPLWKFVFSGVIAEHKAIYFSGAKIMFIIAAYYAAKAWLTVYSHKYVITTERFSEREGIFSRTTHDLELFRVRDITFSEPFALRVLGCGDIILNTSDKTTPIVVLHGLKNPRSVMEIIRKNVDIMRDKKGVKEIEM